MKADLVITNANVLTMNPAQPKAQAIAVKDEKIVKVGSEDDVKPWIGKDTRLIDLHGKTVLPGLIDTHIHVVDFGKVLMWLDLNRTKSIQELKRLVKNRAQSLPKGKWIIGRGWKQTDFAEKRLPCLADLDEVSPDNPVVLFHQAEQMCLVNSSTLQLAGITSKTGVLSGEETNLVWCKVPQPSEEELLDATNQACQEILKAGVTSVHWIALAPNEIAIIKKLHASGKLPIRVYLIVPHNMLSQAIDAELDKASDDMLKLGAAIIFSDGYLASRTAALSEPYSDAPAEKGKLLYTPQELAAIAEKISKAHLQLVIHAVGDRAVEAALATLEKIGAFRPRIEQAAVLTPRLIERMKKLQVHVSLQPQVVASEFAVWSAETRLGAARAQWLFPVKTLLENGVKVLGGSDCPMEPLNPMLGIQAAVTRDAFVEQRVSILEALRMVTLDAAYGCSEENLKGSIEEGKLADLSVFSDDPTAVSPSKISTVMAEMTFLGGQLVFSKTVQ